MKYAHPSRVCVGVNNYKIILNIWTRADKTIAAMRASKAGKEKIPEPIIMPATSAQDRHMPIDFVILVLAVKLDGLQINHSNLELIADALVLREFLKHCVSSYVLYHEPSHGL